MSLLVFRYSNPVKSMLKYQTKKSALICVIRVIRDSEIDRFQPRRSSHYGEKPMSKTLKGFITYSHEDTEAKDELRKRLAVMEQNNELITWDDGQLTPGDEALQEDILKKVADSDLLLYLVSAASLDSKNCNKELAEALKQEIRVIPIILEYCDWLNHQLSGFEVLPYKGKPITKWENEGEGWQNVVDGVRKAINEMRNQVDLSSTVSDRKLLAELAFQHGNVLMMLGQLNMAIEVYSDAIRLNPRHTNAYNNRGITLHIKGEHNLAIKDYTRTIELEPDHVGAFNNRGITYGEKAKYALAIKDYHTALKLDPELFLVYNNLGIAYFESGNFDKAIENYNKVIEVDPEFAEVYHNRGNSCLGKGEVERAIKDYNKALKLKPDYPVAYNSRGEAYRIKGENERALKNYSTAIRLNPDYVEAYVNRGLAYRSKGEVDSAIKDYNTAIKLKPDYINAYNDRGTAYIEKKDFDRAIKNFNIAIGLNPEFATVYYNRGLVYTIKEDFDRAIADFDTVLRLDPKFVIAYYIRAEAWLRLKKWNKAKTDLLTAKKNGLDIIARFRLVYKNVEAFEKRHHVKLPKDIALMLTQRRRDRYPKLQKVLDADGKPLESPNVVNLRSQLRNTGPPLGEYVKSKPAFGINTAPTEAFVVDEATRDKLLEEHPSSMDILKPFLHRQDLRRWYVDKPQQWLIFTHRGIAINDYPAILKHLEKYQETLSKRKGKQEWYELPVSLSDTERFAQPKLVCPDTYNHQTFAVDTAGYYYGKTSYLIPTQEKWLCGLLNSRTVEWFYSQVSNQLTIDPLRARSGYIQQIPIPDITPVHKALIAKIVDYLIYLQQQPEINSKDLKYARDRIMLGYFERVIDGLVYEAYLPEELHESDKVFLQPLLDEGLPSIEEIQGHKMSAFRDIFELLYDRMHLVRRHLYFLDSIKPVRIIQGKL